MKGCNYAVEKVRKEGEQNDKGKLSGLENWGLKIEGFDVSERKEVRRM